MKFDSLMIDIETLSTHTNATVLSIGAVPFNRRGGSDPIDVLLARGFYDVFSLVGQNERSVEPSTLVWWLHQNDRAQDVIREAAGKTEHFSHTMDRFIDWVYGVWEGEEFPNAKTLVWANSPSFDLVILRDAWQQAEREWPFSFRNERDYRTLTREVGADYPVEETLIPHHALRDAVYQVSVLQKLYYDSQITG